MDNIKIKILTDFSPCPGPRYRKEGANSGEEFRETVLLEKIKQAIAEKKKLVVDLDGCFGFGTSFIEESFGGLIRVNHLEYDDIICALEIISNEQKYLKENIFRDLKKADENK